VRWNAATERVRGGEARRRQGADAPVAAQPRLLARFKESLTRRKRRATGVKTDPRRGMFLNPEKAWRSEDAPCAMAAAADGCGELHPRWIRVVQNRAPSLCQTQTQPST